MPDHQTSSGNGLPPITQPQLPPGPAEITFTKTWTGKVAERKATQRRRAWDEVTETVRVVEVCGDLGAAIKDHGTHRNRILQGGLSGEGCIEEGSQ